MSLWSAESVNPDTVTQADIAEVAADLGLNLNVPVAADFFESGVTYRRNDTFRCVAVGVGILDHVLVAIGLLPVNLGGEATWEFGAMT